MVRNDSVDGLANVTPRITQSRHRWNEPSPRTHAERGMHLVVYGANTGTCMCVMPCCQDESGCTCKSCAGIGHTNCSVAAAKREQRLRWRANAAAKNACADGGV